MGVSIRSLVGVTLIALALVFPGSARANWLRAETKHFVVYSDDREATVRRLATDLELFDSRLRRFHSTGEQDGAGSNKLTVFVVENVQVVQKLCGRCPNVYGFYNGRASGSVAFTPRNVFAESDAELNARTVLFHEYAHHFLFGNYAMAYPAWFSEGYAEFASTFRRDKTGLTIGAAATHRAYGLLSGLRMPATKLFDPPAKMSADDIELLYGRGWLLTHYIMFDRGRMAQFDKYLALFNAGTPSVAAATQAFGDLNQLDRALDTYLRASTIQVLTTKTGVIPNPDVAVRALSPGEAAMIGFRTMSSRGVNDKTAGPLFAKARVVADRYPDDTIVQGWLAEMAYDADVLDAADAAADRAIAQDSKSAQGLLYKGLIDLRRAERVKAPPSAWAAARKYVVQANQLDPDSAMPLFVYYNSFAMEGRKPTRNAIDGLLRAQELAPQDGGLRFAAVVQCIHDGQLDRARQLLRPLAFDPHSDVASGVTKLLGALETAKDQTSAEAALSTAMKDSPKAD